MQRPAPPRPLARPPLLEEEGRREIPSSKRKGIPG